MSAVSRCVCGETETEKSDKGMGRKREGILVDGRKSRKENRRDCIGGEIGGT